MLYELLLDALLPVIISFLRSFPQFYDVRTGRLI